MSSKFLVMANICLHSI